MLRPEQLVISAPTEGEAVFLVTANLFKGNHFIVKVKSQDVELSIQVNYPVHEVGEYVGLDLVPHPLCYC